MAKVSTNPVVPYDRPMDVNVIMTVLHPQPIKFTFLLS